mmetsp:Transcript_3244/g.9161  ORF Transcript_3244/g.9161 Transcript_3244/m.9161 type:complete len:310 (-) Transcript_3244:712-1641(-)
MIGSGTLCAAWARRACRTGWTCRLFQPPRPLSDCLRRRCTRSRPRRTPGNPCRHHGRRRHRLRAVQAAPTQISTFRSPRMCLAPGVPRRLRATATSAIVLGTTSSSAPSASPALLGGASPALPSMASASRRRGATETGRTLPHATGRCCRTNCAGACSTEIAPRGSGPAKVHRPRPAAGRASPSSDYPPWRGGGQLQPAPLGPVWPPRPVPACAWKARAAKEIQQQPSPRRSWHGSWGSTARWQTRPWSACCPTFARTVNPGPLYFLGLCGNCSTRPVSPTVSPSSRSLHQTRLGSRLRGTLAQGPASM